MRGEIAHLEAQTRLERIESDYLSEDGDGYGRGDCEDGDELFRDDGHGCDDFCMSAPVPVAVSKWDQYMDSDMNQDEGEGGDDDNFVTDRDAFVDYLSQTKNRQATTKSKSSDSKRVRDSSDTQDGRKPSLMNKVTASNGKGKSDSPGSDREWKRPRIHEGPLQPSSSKWDNYL